jgi:hypothetical protein
VATTPMFATVSPFFIEGTHHREASVLERRDVVGLDRAGAPGLDGDRSLPTRDPSGGPPR